MINFIKNLFRKKYPTGLLPDPPDPRDYELLTIQPEIVALPDEFDLRDRMAEIGRQHYGSCTAWAGTGVKEYWDRKEYVLTNLSEKFVYHNIKKISGLWTIQGDYLRNSLKALCDYGSPLLKDWADTKMGSWEEYVKHEPPAEIYVKAKEFKGKTYWRVGKTLENFRQAIFQNQCPVATGMRWWSSYKPLKDGKLPLPSGTKRGGHAISCVGWTEGKLWFRNSWGKSWGKDGYFYIPFDEFDKHEIWDCWVLLDLPKPKPETGWVAESCITEVGSRFHKGDTIKSIYTSWRVNIRESPAIDSGIIGKLNPGEKAEVIEGGKKVGKYIWWKIKK